MDGLNSLLKEDAAAFMKKYVLFTEDLDKKPATGVYDFDLFQEKDKKDKTVIMPSQVKLRRFPKELNPELFESIKAHWLPWEPGKTTRIELDSKQAKFFFTAMLAGCRVTVAGNTVLHIAGDTKFNDKGNPTHLDRDEDVAGQAAGKKWRDDQQAKELGDKAPAARTYSSTVPMKEGGYKGADGGFVVGRFKNGSWSFIGQAWEDENDELKVLKLTELVGGDFAVPQSK